MTELQKLKARVEYMEENWTPIIRNKCYKCEEDIVYTEVFYYCPFCLEHQ